AKDGRKLLDVVDPEVVYGERDIEEVIQEGQAFVELPLGQGDVDWAGYLRALNEIGYKGFLTIEREVGADPEADIGMAVRFLRERIGGGK
ncbi:MAG: TIM barrel protein, partial [Clostridia bacterium]|nr:TIM barrel protein [Clostridia bacterium]